MHTHDFCLCLLGQFLIWVVQPFLFKGISFSPTIAIESVSVNLILRQSIKEPTPHVWSKVGPTVYVLRQSFILSFFSFCLCSSLLFKICCSYCTEVLFKICLCWSKSVSVYVYVSCSYCTEVLFKICLCWSKSVYVYVSCSYCTEVLFKICCNLWV
jgi:hypothetical protein